MWRVCFLIAVCCATSALGRYGTVVTRSGETHAGQIRLETNEVVVVNATRGSQVRVSLTNLMELSFERPKEGIDQDRNASKRNHWEAQDLGRARTPGRSRVTGGFYELAVSTRNLPESRHFLHRKVEGDTEIAARIISISPAAGFGAAGLMISEGLESDAPFTAVTLTSDRRVVVQRRATPQSGIETRSDRLPAQWLKLRRQGTNVAAHQSSDGRRWKIVHSAAVKWGAPVFVGLLATAEYQHESGVEEVRCGFDHVRQAPYLVADWFVPRVELESGSMVLGRIRQADFKEIRFDSVFDPAPLSTRAVSRIMFDWLPPQAQVPGGRPGVVLASGEFVEGLLDSIEANRLAINSVLFGRRVFDIHGEVAAVVLRPTQSQDPIWELTTNDRSRWIGASLEITKDELGIWDASLGRRAFAAYDLDLVRLVRPAGR
jgi:hypothetical protein